MRGIRVVGNVESTLQGPGRIHEGEGAPIRFFNEDGIVHRFGLSSLRSGAEDSLAEKLGCPVSKIEIRNIAALLRHLVRHHKDIIVKD